jgi:hypothetical protein
MNVRVPFVTGVLACIASTAPALAQTPAPQAHQHHQMTTPGGWHFMQDGLVLGLFNDQGGPRGGDEFKVPNWWMGMLSRQKDRHQFGLNMMFSLDPATVGKQGYREIFQVGEAFDGKPLIDRQHPHDLLMQLAASWRLTFSERTAFTLSGGPAGEPTLGPVAFMHRPSASNLVLAPLGHHTFDSTHISFGVLAASVDYGRWTVEGSVFNGREPDEHRWDFDFAEMDSVAGRVWFRPAAGWEAQVSTGYLRDPEELTPGNAVRTTASLGWMQQDGADLRALTIGYGVNAAHDERRHGVFGEYSIEKGRNGLTGRIEFQQVETAVLLTGEVPDDDHHEAEPPALVTAISLAGTRRFLTVRGFEAALGAQVVFHVTPDPLTGTHGDAPVSWQLFLRLRLPTGNMGRMWNMRMSQAHQMK